MLYSSTHIPYLEYRVIGRLLDAQPQAVNGQLRALIAFGELVATGNSYDLNLLEVVTGWQGPRSVSYGSTEALPLRGRLNLYFLTPEEFEHPAAAAPAGQTIPSLTLLRQVQPAYAVLLENPSDYANQVLSRPDFFSSEEVAAQAGASDPITFFKQQAMGGSRS